MKNIKNKAVKVGIADAVNSEVVVAAEKSEKLCLDQYLTKSGLCSRRKADELIKAGKITVNHWKVTDPVYVITSKDTVRFEKRVVQPKKEGDFVYIALYKPVGVVTTAHDPEGRHTVFDLLDERKIGHRVFPIGRLDIVTSGILLLTNDGELTHILAHPKYAVQKTYQVTLDRVLLDSDAQKIKNGLYLKDGLIAVDKLEIGYHKNRIKVTIHSGRNRIVRRIFEALSYTVEKLERVSFAGISKKNLMPGQWRMLTLSEIQLLRRVHNTRN